VRHHQPVVNSYKRINALPTLSGATWSPNTITYAGKQLHPHDPCARGRPVRFRLGDGPAKPYLLQAAIWSQGSTASRIAAIPASADIICIPTRTSCRRQEAAAQSSRALRHWRRPRDEGRPRRGVVCVYLKLKHA